ncbi:MAG TPA: hypothetical protein VK961_13000 [Chthoniobacter sp.]|nr:hypothetical protein [Chthoniobacter sp.]
MITFSASSPESLSYLPAVFRAQSEQAGEGRREDPLPILLRVFESNLHLVEQMIVQSHRWFEPWQSTSFASAASPPWFSPRDFTDLAGLAYRLATPDDGDPVSAFLRDRLSPETAAIVQRVTEGDTKARTLEDFGAALAADLNRLLKAGDLYERQRFSHVRFAPETKELLPHRNTTETTSPRLGRLLLQDAFPRELAALPAAPAFLKKNWEREFLGWLAGWLNLEPNRDWFEDPRTPGSAEGSLAGERYPRFKQILSEIAGLYRLRGTCRGLREMARVLLGLEVEIRERTWPRGMEIGRHSIIGLQTLLLDQPDLDSQFVLVVPIAGPNGALLPAPGAGREVSLLGEKPGTVWLPEFSEATTEERANGRAWSAVLHRLNHLVEQNKPAHTRCFLSFLYHVSPTPTLPPMVIGCSSIVSQFLIL